MPMGDLNATPTLVVTMMKLQMEWDTLAKESGMKYFAEKTIVDAVLLYGCTANKILV